MRHGCWSCLQVYDLQDHRPGPVLKAIFSNLDAAAAAGDTQVQLRYGAVDAGAICTGVAPQTAVRPHGWRHLHSKSCRLDSRLSGKAVTADAGSILSGKLKGSCGWRRRHSCLDSGDHCRAGPQSRATRGGVPHTSNICCGCDQGLISANVRLKTAVPHPPVNVHPQVLPLGTGNDLSLTFGWGNTFLPAWLRR